MLEGDATPTRPTGRIAGQGGGLSHTTAAGTAFGLQSAETFQLSGDAACAESLTVPSRSGGGPRVDFSPSTGSQPRFAERRTHTYVRHGTTSLAALNIATGFVIGQVLSDRAREFTAPPRGSLSTSFWQLATHKTAAVRLVRGRPHLPHGALVTTAISCGCAIKGLSQRMYPLPVKSADLRMLRPKRFAVLDSVIGTSVRDWGLP